MSKSCIHGQMAQDIIHKSDKRTSRHITCLYITVLTLEPAECWCCLINAPGLLKKYALGTRTHRYVPCLNFDKKKK